jgi:hypothetical protein
MYKLTTGQMIDQLKEGEVAENKLEERFVKKAGSVVRADDFSIPMKTTHVRLEQKWRIIPAYVAFDDAMMAMRDGKTVLFHPHNENTTLQPEPIKLVLHSDFSPHNRISHYSFKDLILGNWTIES